MKRSVLIWSGALVLYLAFWAWYGGIRGPLSEREVEMYMERIAEQGSDPHRIARMRKFLEEDTGGEFVMVNAILMRDQPLSLGEVTPDESPDEVMRRYMAYMMPALLARASHPLLGGQAAAPALEAWGIQGAQEWTMAGMMRYRSRRDLMEIATDPRFQDAHVYKTAAVEKTIAFPIDPVFQVGGPRVLAALFLLMLAAMLHLVLGRATPSRPLEAAVVA